jgi:protocatechuate 4,5-dioxygenase alpha chain
MSAPRDYESIPGTYVSTRIAAAGYHPNSSVCLSTIRESQGIQGGQAAYLDRFPLTPEQKQSVLTRDWLGMLKVGGNIYYTIKIAFCDGLTFQDVAGMMCSMPKEEYARMMMSGGRKPEGNLYKKSSAMGEPLKVKQ